MLTCILASGNVHKASEFAASFEPCGLLLRPAPAALDVEENASSFAGNARLKAIAYANAFGENALADDSGLCVDALGGDPGIHSARYAAMGDAPDLDPDRTAANNRKLLRALAATPDPDKRQAHFVCALCLVVKQPHDLKRLWQSQWAHKVITFFDAEGQVIPPHPKADDARLAYAELAVEGIANGQILTQPSGNQGFGYDPLFFCPETNTTFAQLTREQKLSVSHRGRAIAAFMAAFSALGLT
ncbi:MAG: non-canonical purine NTP pyrophosphatase [Proteobacteria bacterium]|nr:non-canonical purine NTP pyrophosphatase [Pseudomonadota bacterium]